MGAAIACGAGRLALKKAAAYAREREVWGAPIGTHQAIAHPLAEAKIDLELARLMLQKAAVLYDAGAPGAGESSNMAKYAAAEAAIECVDRAIQTHGGNGFALEYGLSDMWWGVRLTRTAPVSRNPLPNYVAEHSLGLPKSYLIRPAGAGTMRRLSRSGWRWRPPPAWRPDRCARPRATPRAGWGTISFAVRTEGRLYGVGRAPQRARRERDQGDAAGGLPAPRLRCATGRCAWVRSGAARADGPALRQRGGHRGARPRRQRRPRAAGATGGHAHLRARLGLGAVEHRRGRPVAVLPGRIDGFARVRHRATALRLLGVDRAVTEVGHRPAFARPAGRSTSRAAGPRAAERWTTRSPSCAEAGGAWSVAIMTTGSPSHAYGEADAARGGGCGCCGGWVESARPR